MLNADDEMAVYLEACSRGCLSEDLLITAGYDGLVWDYRTLSRSPTWF